MSDNEEDSALADLKDLEFKLLHDLTQLQVATPVTEPCYRECKPKGKKSLPHSVCVNILS